VNVRRTAAAAVFAALACTTVHAQDAQWNAVPPIESIFAGLIQEQDVILAFRYLRDALDAVLDGREPPPADALIERGQTITNELNRRGAAYARSVLDAIEAVMRDAVKEPQRVPPSDLVQRQRI
jgi:hypothetical protein